MTPLASSSRRLLASSLAALVATASPGIASACGGLFCMTVPVEQNAERILFEVNPGGTVTVTVEIAYVGEAAGFSWVVPVPETPTLDVAPPSALRVLDVPTSPLIINPPIECNGGFSPPMSAGGVDDTANESDGGVVVEDLPQVGPFDPEVVSSDDAEAMIDWLNENGYLITPPMEPLVASYVASGMKFLAMKLAPEAGVQDIAPISMTYAAATPMVPISLTAVSAEPEMGVLVYVAASARYASDNYANLQIPLDSLQVDPMNGTTNYYALVSWLIDEAGGKAFIEQWADEASTIRASIEGNFLGVADEDEARTWALALVDRTPWLTRLYTRVSGWEMDVDPTFVASSDTAPLSRTLDLSDRPPVEICDQQADIVPCGTKYCGVDALCATTEAGVEGCVCADGSTARAISEPLRPGGIAVPTVTCQVNDLEFLASEVEAGGVADPCETYSCGDSGACVAVNGFPTCRCDEGFAAVPVGDGTAVCARVRRTFGPDQIGRLAGCSSCDASAGSASLFSLLALLPLIRRRRS